MAIAALAPPALSRLLVALPLACSLTPRGPVDRTPRAPPQDAAYNRHVRTDKNLPQWFLDDEKRFAEPSGFGVELDEGNLAKAADSLKGIASRTIGKVSAP